MGGIEERRREERMRMNGQLDSGVRRGGGCPRTGEKIVVKNDIIIYNNFFNF